MIDKIYSNRFFLTLSAVLLCAVSAAAQTQRDIIAERATIVRTFGDRYFAGATLVMTNTLLGDSDIDINYRKMACQAVCGGAFVE